MLIRVLGAILSAFPSATLHPAEAFTAVPSLFLPPLRRFGLVIRFGVDRPAMFFRVWSLGCTHTQTKARGGSEPLGAHTHTHTHTPRESALSGRLSLNDIKGP
jgi:hypothetical protein